MPEEHATILVVDDMPTNLKLMQQILGHDYNLKFANNGKNALAGAEKHNPDLILLDIMMPEMDGYEVCRRLKESKQNSHIPVIFVTDLDTVEDESKGFQLGCVDYITKPISPSIALARVQTHLELYNARKKLETVNQDLVIAVDEKTAHIREQYKELLTLNKQLTREKEKALASDRLKAEFLEQISHEIRTPLNHIVGMSHLLGMDCESMDESEKDEMIEGIMEGGERLTRTIELIMEVAKIKTGNYKIELESIDLNKLIYEVIDLHKDIADKKALSLLVESFPDPVEIMGDRYSITKIIDHLIDNAIKFTPKGSVKILSERTDKDDLSIIIEDTGIGMSQKYQKELFKSFSQEDQGSSRKFDGNGLGLAFVKYCCDLNNVQILVESTKGSGSRFTIIFKNLN